jgi:hypothetical protein
MLVYARNIQVPATFVIPLEVCQRVICTAI